MRRVALILCLAALGLTACQLDDYVPGERLSDQCVDFCSMRVDCDTTGSLAGTYAADCGNACQVGDFNNTDLNLTPDIIACIQASNDPKTQCGAFQNCLKAGGPKTSDDDGGGSGTGSLK